MDVPDMRDDEAVELWIISSQSSMENAIAALRSLCRHVAERVLHDMEHRMAGCGVDRMVYGFQAADALTEVLGPAPNGEGS